jgi:Peptidase M15
MDIKLAFQVDGKYIDATTNTPIDNPSGYEVMEWPKEIPFPSNEQIQTTGIVPYLEDIARESSRDYDYKANEKMAPRDASNNYGYQNKSFLMEASQMLPGAPGMAMKAINVLQNIDNKAAINSARNMLGLEDSPRMSNVLKDTKGSIANAKIGNEEYSIGFEALDNKGRTTLTPEEARRRGMMTDGVTELSKAENKVALKDFKTDKKKQPGVIPENSVAPNRAEDLSGNIFDLNETTPMPGPTDDIGENLAHGMGLAGVSKTFRERLDTGVNYSHPDRGPVTKGLQEDTVNTMNALASNTPGGINVSSAYRDPATNAAVGGAKASLHMSGNAFDMSTKGLSDQQKRDLVERSIMAGGQEIGTYKDGSLHVGTVQRFDQLPDQPDLGGVTGMYNYSRYNYDKAPDWMKDGMQVSRLAPTPTERPEPPTGLMAMGENLQKDVDLSSPVNPDYSSTASAAVSMPTVDRTSLNITDEDKSLAAMTLAGEIDPSKTDLSTPQGIQEAYGILSTIENRTPKYGSMSKAITAPNQYSTWGNQAAANTANKNYGLNPSVYDGLVKNYLDDPKSNLGFTSYHSNVVNPDWSGKMQNVTDIGPHKFGFLDDYNAPNTKMNVAAPRERPTLDTANTSSGFMGSSMGANRPASNASPDREYESKSSMASTTSGAKSTKESSSRTPMSSPSKSTSTSNSGSSGKSSSTSSKSDKDKTGR